MTGQKLATLAVLAPLLLGLSSTPTPRQMLAESWRLYKRTFIQADGRVIDWRRDGLTTSEGQSYAMLRAVWMDDRDTFERAFRWANDNLRVRGDRLYAWKWGRTESGAWQVLDRASAADADQDIAVALLVAARRWGRSAYRNEARVLLADIWKHEVVATALGPVLCAGDWAAKLERPVVNPSYLAPYAYRLFAGTERQDWRYAVDASFRLLEGAAALSSVGLWPDWCAIDPKTGAVTVAEGLSSDHSYDAWRVAWRLALDAGSAPRGDQRALRLLRQQTFLPGYFQGTNKLPASVRADGSVKLDEENVAALGAYLPAWRLVAPAAADRAYATRIVAGYAGGGWGDPRDYYAQNWVWFGLAQWAGIARVR
jgi:endoglucanase